jgi:hypothetical protein
MAYESRKLEYRIKNAVIPRQSIHNSIRVFMNSLLKEISKWGIHFREETINK